MSSLSLTVSKIGAATYQYDWSSTSSVYLKDQNGQLYYPDDGALPTTQQSITTPSTDYSEPPIVEVNTATSSMALTESPPYIIVQWRGSTLWTEYQVQVETTTGTYGTTMIVPEDAKGYYHYQSTKLTDISEASYRILAVDAQSQTSLPMQYDVMMIRNPDPPSVSFSFSTGTGLLTVSTR